MFWLEVIAPIPFSSNFLNQILILLVQTFWPTDVTNTYTLNDTQAIDFRQNHIEPYQSVSLNGPTIDLCKSYVSAGGIKQTVDKTWAWVRTQRERKTGSITVS